MHRVCAAHAGAPRASTLTERIDDFVAREVRESRIPGVAIAVLRDCHPPHVRGFGHNGSGKPIDGDTPFPIGSLTKSFTAALARQAIEAGHLEIDAPVQRYLPWFRVADEAASARMTLRHLLNQTSGLSRAAGITPLLAHDRATVEDIARSLRSASLTAPPGAQFEYSNANFVLVGAVLQAALSQPWATLVREHLLQPLAMTQSFTDLATARGAGLSATHRIWFAQPVPHQTLVAPGLAPAGGMAASAHDLARYLQMLLMRKRRAAPKFSRTPSGGLAKPGLGALSGGQVNGYRLLSAHSVTQMLAPASPPGRSRLLATDFSFRYGEGWFSGPFGAAADARWHLGNLASFAAWMVLLPHSRAAIVVLINANSEFPFGHVNAVFSRLPLGVVSLLHATAAPHGPSLQEAYRSFNAAAATLVPALSALAWWAWRCRSNLPSATMTMAATGLLVALYGHGLRPAVLGAAVPDLALVLVTATALLFGPLVLRLARQ